MNFIKTTFICFLLFLCNNYVYAQVHRITHSVKASIGFFKYETINNVEEDDFYYDVPVSYKWGYVISYSINQRWSLETGLDIIYDSTSATFGESDLPKEERKINDKYGFLHIPVLLQYNIGKDPLNRNHFSVGLGPSLNITVLNDQYKYKDNYLEILNGRDKLKTLNIGLQINVSYTFRQKYSFSLDCNFGLLNMQKNYNIGNGEKYLFHFWPTFSYQF